MVGWLGRITLRKQEPPPPVATEPDPAGKLLGQSLLRLEINTIVKNNMTGEPMQPLPHALLDLAIDYSTKMLEELGVRQVDLAVALYGEKGRVMDRHDMVRELAPTFDKFSALRRVAQDRRKQLEAARSPPQAPPSKEELALDRIIQGAEVVIDIIRRLPQPPRSYGPDEIPPFNDLWSHLGMTRSQLFMPGLKLGPYDLSPTAMLRLRKIWDLGTEEIVAQTTIHLTGDVLMRLSPMLLQPENEKLLQIHKDAVKMSTDYWRDLMNAAVTLATGAARALLGKPQQ